MIIVSIEPYSNGYDAAIYIDQELWRIIPRKWINHCRLQGSYPTLEVWNMTWGQWETKYIRNLAVNKLRRKRYFVEELKQALTQRGGNTSYCNGCCQYT